LVVGVALTAGGLILGWSTAAAASIGEARGTAIDRPRQTDVRGNITVGVRVSRAITCSADMLFDPASSSRAGADAHKRSRTVVVVDELGRKLGAKTLGNTWPRDTPPGHRTRAACDIASSRYARVGIISRSLLGRKRSASSAGGTVLRRPRGTCSRCVASRNMRTSVC
jgi:hypothetical protein